MYTLDSINKTLTLRQVFSILFFLIFSMTFLAQEIVEVVQIEKDDGLKDRTVDRIIRDQNGYFILFMLNTIQRYDGKTFETIDISAIKSNKIEVRDIQEIDQLDDGTITLYSPKVNVLFYIHEKQNRVSSVPLQGIPIVNQGQLYLLKRDGPKSEKYVLHSAKLSTTLISEQLNDTALSSDIENLAIIDDLIYLQHRDLSIQIIRKNQLLEIPIKGKIVQRDNRVYLFDKDKIYMLNGTIPKEIATLHDKSFTCNILKLDQHQNIVSAYSGRPRFHDRIYVLDNNDSLHVMDNIVGVTDVFKDFHTDDAFHRWMLGGYNGIHIVNLLREGAHIIHKNHSIKKGEFGNVISGVASDGMEEIIYSRELEGLYAYELNSGLSREELVQSTANGEYVRNSKLYFNKATNTYFSHAYRYDGKSDIYQSNINTGSSQKYVIPYKLNDIYATSSNTILFGGFKANTANGILGSYDITNRTHKIIRDDTREVRSITYDNDTETYWLGTYEGLYVLDSDFNDITRFSRKKEGPEFMAQDHIVMTARYHKWMIACSYGGGIYIIDPDEYKIMHKIDEHNGLNDNSAIGAINDSYGHCWITTFNGISVIDTNLQVIRKIYEHDGLPNREFNSKAIAKDGQGNIYAGTLNGVAMLNPSKVLKWQKSYQMDIKSIIGHQGNNFERLDLFPEIPLYENYDSLIINYNLPDYHYYPYIEEIIDIDIDGDMDYSMDNNKIILKGFGTGEFVVNISLEGTSKKTKLKIIRHNNFKKTFSILLISIGIGLLAWFVSKQIIKRNKKREEEKTKLHKRMADLQLSSLQSQMNPHFIFNALGSIQYFIQTYDTVKADEFLSNFAMLMRSILESSKSKYISLSEEIKLLKLYIGLEKIRFENLFEYRIEIDKKLDLQSNVPPMIIQPFVENAINHGLYHLKERKGRLILKFEAINTNELRISISDNGIGRTASTRLRHKNHKSRGMQIVKERIETINSSQDLKVNVTTTDVEKDGNPNGTEIIIDISELN